MADALPSLEEVQTYLREKSNWGRWGADDQTGAMNLITPQKRAAAATLVRSGRTVSLSRPFPKTPAPNNPNPAQHWLRSTAGPRGGGAVDYYAISYHGYAATHIDALCHVWDDRGLWNGRPPEEIRPAGTRWGGIENWSNGIVTRGVLLDVPKYRGQPFVTLDAPVHGAELEKIVAAQGVTLEPGDAVVVYSGREAYGKSNPVWGAIGQPQPGLHASCLPFVREHDASLIVWDMMDMTPSGYDMPWSMHAALFAFGVGLVDNALLEPLAAACAEENRYEFMLVLAPLVVVGGTGSPLNPIALF
jgi:kynurenine formamidase